MKLFVFHNTNKVGELSTSPNGLRFQYDPEYLGGGNYPLSIALPLQEAPFDERTTLPFFEGLLPEGEQRGMIADYLHISVGSTMKLLAAIAGDCVGNLTVLTEDMDINEIVRNSGYSALSESELTGLLLPQQMNRISFLATNRLSFSGAQAKIGLFFNGKDWCRPEGLAPSSHIIKPTSAAYESLLADELFVMTLAQQCGLPTPAVSVIEYGTHLGLAIERFDRQMVKGNIIRLQQEDFCQALSYLPTHKYEADGGPGLQDIFTTTSLVSDDPLTDVDNLLKVVLFNYLIGNCDAHAKNFSLTRNAQNGSLRLSPAYDLITTTYYPGLLRSMGMKIGRHAVIDKISNDDFELLAVDSGMSLLRIRSVLKELVNAIENSIFSLPTLIGEAHPILFDEAKKLSEHVQREIESRARILC